MILIVEGDGAMGNESDSLDMLRGAVLSLGRSVLTATESDWVQGQV